MGSGLVQTTDSAQANLTLVFPGDKLGMTLKKVDGGDARVESLADGGQAATLGVMVGDRVVCVNEKRASYDFMMTETSGLGRPLTIGVYRSGRPSPPVAPPRDSYLDNVIVSPAKNARTAALEAQVASLIEQRIAAESRVAELTGETAAAAAAVGLVALDELELRIDESHRVALQRVRDARANILRCGVCMDAQRSAIFLPCKHCVCCLECAAAMSRCAVCDQDVVELVAPRSLE